MLVCKVSDTGTSSSQDGDCSAYITIVSCKHHFVEYCTDTHTFTLQLASTDRQVAGGRRQAADGRRQMAGGRSAVRDCQDIYYK